MDMFCEFHASQTLCAKTYTGEDTSVGVQKLHRQTSTYIEKSENTLIKLQNIRLYVQYSLVQYMHDYV